MKRFAVLVAALAATACSPSDPPVEATTPLFDGLGPYTRPVTTTSAQAQRYVDQGFAFLFAFNHDEAVRSFEQALAYDSTCAMAAYGVASALGPHINFPVVSPEKNAQALAMIIGRAQEYGTKESDVHRAMIEAMRLRYPDPYTENRVSYDSAYAMAMLKVWERYPDDADVGAMTAEALMDLRPWDQWQPTGEPQPGTALVLEILEKTLTLNPDQPLALHLMIHATEASHHPEHGIAAADRLRDLCPGLGHLVHMPSHTDVRVGAWDKCVTANAKAMTTDSVYRSKSAGQTLYRVYMAHNYHMRAFGCMMIGRSQEAIDVLDAMVQAIPDSFRMEWAWAIDGFYAMPLEARMRFGRWDEILAYPELPADVPLSIALRHYARGVAYAAKDNVKQAKAELAAFEDAAAKVPAESIFGNNTGAAMLTIARHVLQGEIEVRAGNLGKGLAELRKAVEAEDALRYDEPPSWIQPTRHTLGASLMMAGKFSEAEQVYRADLQKLPNNGWSLYGLARALELQGKTAEAEPYQQQFADVWKSADLRITSSCLCLP